MCLSPPLYDSGHASVRPLGLGVSPHLQGLGGGGVELDNVAFNYVSDTPPWELERPKARRTLSRL